MTMPFVFGTVLTYLSIAFAALLLLTLILFFINVLRQRKIKKEVIRLGSQVEASLAEAADQRRVDGERGVQKITETLKMLDPIQSQIKSLEMQVAQSQKEIINKQEEIEESFMEMSPAIASMEKIELDFENIRAKLDQIEGEIGQAHQWLDELRILEKVVLNLIGPEKLRSLIAKEKSQAATPTPNSNKRKSIL